MALKTKTTQSRKLHTWFSETFIQRRRGVWTVLFCTFSSPHF